MSAKKAGKKKSSRGILTRARNKKKQFVDEELLRTLEAHGFKRKPSIAQPAQLPKVKNKLRKKGKAAKLRRKATIKTKPKIFIRHIKPKKEVQPLQEKRGGFFARIAGFFKRKLEEEKEEEKASAQPEVKEIITEVKGETLPEAQPLQEKKEEIVEKPKEPEILEVKEKPAAEAAEETEKLVLKPIKEEKKEEVPRFPVAKEQQEGKQPEIRIPEEKRGGFFARIREKFSMKKEEVDELEPITISSSNADTSYSKNTNPIYLDNAAGEKVSDVLKKEIMPKVQNKDSGESSGIGILFAGKKKKPG